MIFGLVIGDHTIHIKSDLPEKPVSEPEKAASEPEKPGDGESEDDEAEDGEAEDGESEDEEPEEEEYEEEYERRQPPKEFLLLGDSRGPLYHSICDMELLSPKDARFYRIRSLEATGNKSSRVQSDLAVKNFKYADHPSSTDLHIEYETLGSLRGEEEGVEEKEEDKSTVQLSLAFLRVNKQVFEEAATKLYSTKTFGFDDPATFSQFFSITCNSLGKPPTPTNGTSLLTMKRNSIKSLHIRAKTALHVHQKILWMNVLSSATFVLRQLEEIRVLFDLSYQGNERFLDQTFWQSHRHKHSFPLLKFAEVRVATDLMSVWRIENGNWVFAFSEGWQEGLPEAIIGHHMDVLFGASLLDRAAVKERNKAFGHDGYDKVGFSDDSDSDDSSPEDPGPDDSNYGPDDFLPDDFVPDDSAPDDSAPEDSGPEDSDPDDPDYEDSGSDDSD